MSTTQFRPNLEAMAEGRRQARVRRERDAIKRVHAWQRWLTSGADFHTEPPRPRDWEFKCARRAA